jgi:hypothetical protein
VRILEQEHIACVAVLRVALTRDRAPRRPPVPLLVIVPPAAHPVLGFWLHLSTLDSRLSTVWAAEIRVVRG